MRACSPAPILDRERFDGPCPGDHALGRVVVAIGRTSSTYATGCLHPQPGDHAATSSRSARRRSTVSRVTRPASRAASTAWMPSSSAPMPACAIGRVLDHDVHRRQARPDGICQRPIRESRLRRLAKRRVRRRCRLEARIAATIAATSTAAVASLSSQPSTSTISSNAPRAAHRRPRRSTAVALRYRVEDDRQRSCDVEVVVHRALNRSEGVCIGALFDELGHLVGRLGAAEAGLASSSAQRRELERLAVVRAQVEQPTAIGSHRSRRSRG